MIRSEIVIGLPEYEITDLQISEGKIRIWARCTGERVCPDCGGQQLRNKGRYTRQVRHENWGLRHCVLHLEACKWQCRACGRYFRERFQGFQDLSQEQRATKMKEAQAELAKSLDGILKPEQVKRFRQIELQVGGMMAFGQPRVQEALKLTDEQKEKINDIQKDLQKEMQEMFQGFKPGGGGDFQESM